MRVALKIFDTVMLLFALFVLLICLGSLSGGINWRMILSDNDAGMSMFAIKADSDGVGFESASYFASDVPEQKEPWIVNDRVFKIESESKASTVQVSWAGPGIRSFAGLSRLEFLIARWAAAICAGLLLFMFIVAFMRRKMTLRVDAETEAQMGGLQS
ncbi:MAG: hypothetical protein ACPGXK_14275 [Phycisphaerae bacterium]